MPREAHGYITRNDGLEYWVFDEKRWDAKIAQSRPRTECERAMKEDIPPEDMAKINGDYNDELYD